jgi:hypothetical protein
MKVKGLPYQTAQLQAMAVRMRTEAEECDIGRKCRTLQERLAGVKFAEKALIEAVRKNSKFWTLQIKSGAQTPQLTEKT